MQGNTTYRAAKQVAGAVEQHFSRQIAEANARGDHHIATPPDTDSIETMIDVAFWASLRREEDHSPKISLAYLSPEQAVQPLLFERRLPLRSGMLIKISPAVERPGIHLGVWQEEGQLYIWGTTRVLPHYCFVLDVSEPGLLVVKHRRQEGYGKFVNVAVLLGDQVKIVSEQSLSIPDCPDVLHSLLGFSSRSTWNQSQNVLVQLAVSMRAHKRGGTLLIVPSGSEEWRESIRHPINYAVSPAYTGLAELVQQVNDKQKHNRHGELNRAIEALAGLTAVDGATIISDKYELYGFGAKIQRREGFATIEEIIVTEPVIGGEAVLDHAGRNGGTRHLSAAQFVYDQRDAIALVASQAGRFTVFSWSPCQNVVQALRIDSLLL